MGGLNIGRINPRRIDLFVINVKPKRRCHIATGQPHGNHNPRRMIQGCCRRRYLIGNALANPRDDLWQGNRRKECTVRNRTAVSKGDRLFR